jgi:adenosylcobinamide-GDP ribazoletransferase
MMANSLDTSCTTPAVETSGRLRELVVPALAALQFLTIAPPLVRRPFSAMEMGRALGFFPLVGLTLGGVLVGVDGVASWLWHGGVPTALVLVAWVSFTGLLHVDGFCDTCDGLFGGRTPEDRLRILRDSRNGSYAVAGGILLLLVKFQALAAVPDRLPALLLAPALGRWAMTFAIVTFPYARAEGLGRSLKDHAGWRQLLLATVTAGLLLSVLASWLGLLACTLAAVVTYLAARFTLTRLPGLTGDVYGAMCEVVETVVLLVFATTGAP